MNDWIPAIALIGFALVVGATLVLSGPVGKALAAWIRGWAAQDAQWLAFRASTEGGSQGAVERLRADVDALTRRLGEVEERLDFAERLLARERQAARWAPPGAER